MKKALINLFIFFLCCTYIYSKENISFRHYSTSDGLSQRSVYSMVQDSRNYIWIGTEHGLNRFDGQNFYTYIYNTNDENSLSDNTIFKLYITKSDELYIGTSIGLSKYIPQNNNFENYYIKKSQTPIYTITEITDRTLLLGTDNGLKSFDKSTKEIKHISLTGKDILCFFNYKDIILVGTSNGLFYFNPHNSTTTKIVTELNGVRISDIKYNPLKEQIWIATLGNGLFCLNKNLKVEKQYINSSTFNIPNFIRRLQLDKEGKLWIGTLNGMYIMESELSLRKIEMNSKTETKQTENSVRTILRDNNDNIWIGTFDNGLYQTYTTSQLFSTFKFDINGHINCMTYDSITNNIIIGCTDNNIYQFNISNNKLSSIIFNTNNLKTPIERIKCIHIDKNGNLLIGTHFNGLFVIDKENKQATEYKLTDMSQDNSCYSMLQNNDNEIWIGGSRGLYIFNTYKKIITRSYINSLYKDIDNAKIGDIHKDKKGNIWLATNKGTYKVKRNKDLYEIEEIKYKISGKNISIPSLEINDEGNHNLWFNSSIGLFRYDISSDSIIKYPLQEVLLDKYFLGMEDDRLGNIWLNSNKGIIYLNHRNNIYTIFDKSIGIDININEEKAVCKINNNRLAFCGSNGLNIISPENINMVIEEPTPVISGFITNNTNNSQTTYNKFGEIASLSFQSSEHNIAIRVSTIDFLGYLNSSYKYKLEGFENEWNYTNENYISYTKLAPGNYKLILKTINHFGKESNRSAILKIVVIPQWYETFLFKFLVTIIILAFIITMVKANIKQIKTKMALEMEQKEKKGLKKPARKK